MLAFLPAPMDDELLYSLLARSNAWLGGRASLPVIQAAFGRCATGIRIGLPSGLSVLAGGLPPGCGLDVDTLVRRHTLQPYFSRLLTAADGERLLQGMTKGWRHGGYAGLSPFRGASHWHRSLVLCPDCVEADVGAHGEASWRRAHQLPGVLVCPTHGTALRTTRTSAIGQSHLICCPTDIRELVQVANPFEHATAWRLARASQWLLHAPPSYPDLERVRRRLRALLAGRGWLKSNGLVRSGLREAVEAAYGRENLAEIGVCLRENRCRTDVQRLWSHSPVARVPPLKLLLLLDFLGAGTSPFEPDDDAAKPPQELRTRPVSTPRRSTIERHRACLRTLVRADGGRPRTLLRRLAPVPYCYLLRHDRQWLETVLPPPLKPRGIVDWDARDRAASGRVRAAVERLAASGLRPRSISASSIATEAGRRSSVLRRAGRSRVLANVLKRAIDDLRKGGKQDA